jgi:hypothetical protein
VPNDSIGPGARVLWCLRRRASDVRCIAYVEASSVEVRILQDRDVVLIEQFVGARAAYESGVAVRSPAQGPRLARQPGG